MHIWFHTVQNTTMKLSKNLTEMESNCDGVAINLEFQTLTKVQVTYGIYTLTPVLTCADQT